MDNTFYLLRHAEIKIDKKLPISKWKLSMKGRKQAAALARKNIFEDIDLILSSREEKAYQTAKPLASKLRKRIMKLKAFDELHRDKGGFLEKKEFERALKFCLTHLDKSVYQWEIAKHGLKCFENGIKRIDRKYRGKNILLVSHGIVINLYFAKLLNKLNRVYERTAKTTFCDYGMVKNKRVIQDIVKK
ncbi:histidine phosphatase family protein [Candidatus Woesearchaeota archaeon]|nr:histidine phosphatase family protein [Candidatus Woesearchaeota archaeon]